MATGMNVHELISVCMIWFSLHIFDIITNFIRPSVMPQVFSFKQMHYWPDGWWIRADEIRGQRAWYFSVILSACFPQTEWSVRATSRVCAYMLMCVITHPSESHIGIYTQSPQLISPPLRRLYTLSSRNTWQRSSLCHPREKSWPAFLKRAAVTMHVTAPGLKIHFSFSSVFQNCTEFYTNCSFSISVNLS